MKTVKIAILDDQIHYEPKQCTSVTYWIPKKNRGYSIREQTIEENILRNGHGDTCLQIISKYIEDVPIELHCFRCFEIGRTSGLIERMLDALEICSELGVHIIHMSIGSAACQDFRAIRNRVRILQKKGIVLVAALDNQCKVTFPAWIPGVFSVCADQVLNDNRYYCCTPSFEHVVFCASGRHLLRENRRMRITPPANSFAAPVITAAAIREINRNQNITPIQLMGELISAVDKTQAFCGKYDRNREISDVPVIWLHGFSHEKEKEIIDRIQERLGELYLCVGACEEANEEKFMFAFPKETSAAIFLSSLVSYFCPDVLFVGETKSACWQDCGLHVWHGQKQRETGEDNIEILSCNDARDIAEKILNAIVTE